MICSTPAFVLKSYDLRETSKIAVFYTRDFGKVKGVLKGFRADRKKFSSNLQSLSLNHIVFYKKRVSEIHLISQCDLLEDFGLAHGPLKTFASASQVVELLDLLMPLEDENRAVFELTFDYLNSLKTGAPEGRLLFRVKMLALSGFKPHFDSCIVCDKKIDREAYFSHVRGGLLCPRCLYEDRHAQELWPGTIASILYIERSAWQSCLRLNMLPRVKKQLDEILSSFILFHVGKTLKTDRFIHELQ